MSHHFLSLGTKKDGWTFVIESLAYNERVSVDGKLWKKSDNIVAASRDVSKCHTTISFSLSFSFYEFVVCFALLLWLLFLILLLNWDTWSRASLSFFLFCCFGIFCSFCFSAVKSFWILSFLFPPFCLNPRSAHKKTRWVFDEQTEGRRYFSCMFFPFCLVFQTLFWGALVMCAIISLDYFVLYIFAFCF